MLPARPAGTRGHEAFSTARRAFAVSQDIEFDMHFAWKQQVAVGSRGPVYRAVCTKAYTTKLGKHINAGTDVAVKVFLLERLSTNQRAQLQTEFQILREIGNIETCEELLDGFQTAADLLLVKTLCPVIPLCDAVATSAPGGLCSEGLVADFSEPVFATVAELHRLDIVHGSISVREGGISRVLVTCSDRISFCSPRH